MNKVYEVWAQRIADSLAGVTIALAAIGAYWIANGGEDMLVLAIFAIMGAGASGAASTWLDHLANRRRIKEVM